MNNLENPNNSDVWQVLQDQMTAETSQMDVSSKVLVAQKST